MKLLRFLLRSSWRPVGLAVLLGAASGAASVALVVLTLRALEHSGESPPPLVATFVAMCALAFVTRSLTHVLISRWTTGAMSSLRMALYQRLLATPLVQLEAIGRHRMLSVLTEDTRLIVGVLHGIPGILVNAVIVLCGALYLGWLSPRSLSFCLIFCVTGVTFYLVVSRRAREHMRVSRESEDRLFRRITQLLDGAKALKMHGDHRRAFLQGLEDAESSLRDSRWRAEIWNDAAVNAGRALFFVAIGLVLFVLPTLSPAEAAIRTSFTLTILYLSSPLEQLVGWTPYFAWAASAAEHVDQLGFSLDGGDREIESTAPLQAWSTISLEGATYRYPPGEGRGEFVLGPVDLTLRRGDVLFVIGGNGSGKTTLAKLLLGLYTPAEGDLRLDARPVDATRRCGFRELFSVVFDDAPLFEGRRDELDARGEEWIRVLRLDHKVRIEGGSIVSGELSRGERKRLALLAALLEDRSIYVFDEWAADQDPVFRREFYLELIPDLARRGKTVVAITHDDRYFGSADRLLKLEEGRIVPVVPSEHAMLPAPSSAESSSTAGEWSRR